ncbi:MAG: 30S ribosomal protein S7 [Patescibacteria group bacterium]
MRGKVKKHIIAPDSVFNDVRVAKLINNVMREGKKTTAQKIIYDAFGIIKEKTKKEPLDVFDLAIRNTSPLLEVKSRRVGGATYQVPREVRGERQLALSMRWIINAAKAKKGKPMREKLAAELIDASNNTGEAVRKKENTHKMAEANRAFAHFTW